MEAPPFFIPSTPQIAKLGQESEGFAKEYEAFLEKQPHGTMSDFLSGFGAAWDSPFGLPGYLNRLAEQVENVGISPEIAAQAKMMEERSKSPPERIGYFFGGWLAALTDIVILYFLLFEIVANFHAGTGNPRRRGKVVILLLCAIGLIMIIVIRKAL